MSIKVGGWADAVLVQSPQEKRPRKSPRKSSPRKFFTYEKCHPWKKCPKTIAPENALPLQNRFRTIRPTTQKIAAENSPPRKKSKRKNVKFIYYIIDKCYIQTCLKYYN